LPDPMPPVSPTRNLLTFCASLVSSRSPAP